MRWRQFNPFASTGIELEGSSSESGREAKDVGAFHAGAAIFTG